MKSYSIDKNLRETIEKHGWASVAVFMVDKDQGQPPLLYTVGLHENFNHPELLLSGIPARTAMGILSPVVDRIKAGESFSHGQMDSRVLDGYPICFAEIGQKEAATTLLKTKLFSDRLPPALQVFWPDQKGNFPWAPGYALNDSHQQRLGIEPKLIQFDLTMPNVQEFQCA